MPELKTVHWNPDATRSKTRCGRRLIEVAEWRKDIADCTCNMCLKLAKGDKPK